tara:strand:- start:8896 stop:10404 length:1509 start_codon:yes stop_codon:yes gene_type:complete
MKFKIIICIIGLTLFTLGIKAQTYIGEVLFGTTYQYAKLSITDSLTTFSLPYIDKDKKYIISEQIKTAPDWKVMRDFEVWDFKTTFSKNIIKGALLLNGTSQPVLFYEQQHALPEQSLAAYEGVFKDEKGNKAIVYAGNGYLHLMSPFSERTMSLKPVENNMFWSVSGETSVFKNLKNNSFHTLLIQNRFHTEIELTKIPPTVIEDAWIPVGEDTIYAKLFIPPTGKKAPACLVLPGGGPTGMANYEYEARFFAAQGMVSLVFDKSGNGKSKGPGNFNLQTFEEKTDQYLQLFSYLQQHPKVDPTKVGVHGPSEGGRLALMMAIDEPSVAFVNATAAPIMNMREGQLYAIQHHVRKRGIVETDNVSITSLWNEYYQGIIDGSILPETIKKANRFRETYERLFLPPDYLEIPGSPSKSDLLNDRVAKEAGKIKCPVFLQYGENDERVAAQKSIQNFFTYASKELPVSVKLYPRANHSFMTPEYEISHGYTGDKLQWLKKIGIL